MLKNRMPGKRLTAGIVIFILCIGCGIAAGCGNRNNDKETEQEDTNISFDKKNGELLLYTDALSKESDGDEGLNAGEIKEIAEVKRGDYSHKMNAIGEICYLDKYYETVDVDNASFKEYKVEVGDKVKKGDTIYTYDVEINEADIRQREGDVLQREKDYAAGYDSRKAEINKAEHELKSLTDNNEIQIKKLEIKKLKQALKEYAETKTDIQKAKSELNEYISGIRSTKMTASHDGYILSLAELNEGDALIKGSVAAVISPRQECVVKVEDISEGKLRYNSEVIVTVEGDKGKEDATIKGIVIGSNNILSTDNAREHAYIKVEDGPKDVNWSNSIKISYTSKELKDVLIIPKAALNYEESGEGRDIVRQAYVYIYENEHAFKRYVEVYDDGGEECVIIQGAVEGQQLAIYK